MDRDRNLLFGVFAVQLRKITPSQLVEAAGAWAMQPERGLATRLIEAGALAEADGNLLNGLVDQAVTDHQGDASAALSTFGGEEQVMQSFRGSILLVPNGGVSYSDHHTERTVLSEIERVPGVQETPGRYTRVTEHARGGMGRVLLVHDEFLDRDVALKELYPDTYNGTASDTQSSPVRVSLPMVSRFLQEARITGQLEHPSIVPVYELGHRHDGSLYYTMKLVRGTSLAAAIRKAQSPAERLQLLPHFVSVCHAIAYAHSRGVIHRDIKPHNIMVGEFGETVVIDWGLAKAYGRVDMHATEISSTLEAMQSGDAEAMAKTRYGQALGTPVYMAPEQALGKLDEITERCDVYALGVVLYELLTGAVPFDGTSVDIILARVVKDYPKPIRELAPMAPPELAAIADRAMRKEASARYQSAKELAEEVERFQTGAVVSAYRYSPVEQMQRWAKRRKAVLVSSAAALAVVLGIAVYSYWSILQARDLEREQREVAEAALATAETAKIEESKARDAAENALYRTRLFVAGKHIANQQYELARDVLWDTAESERNWEWGRLIHLAYPEVRSYYGHERRVADIAVSPTGDRFVSVADDGKAVVWNEATGERLHEFRDHDGAPRTALWAPNGDRILVITDRGVIHCWDLTTDSSAYRIGDAGTSVGEVQLDNVGNRIAAIVNEVELMVFDVTTGARYGRREMGSAQLSGLNIRGDTILCRSGERSILVVGAADLEPRQQIDRDINIVGARLGPEPGEITLLTYNTLEIVNEHGVVDTIQTDFGRFQSRIGFDRPRKTIYVSDSERLVRFDRNERRFTWASTFNYISDWVESDTGLRVVGAGWDGFTILEGNRAYWVDSPSAMAGSARITTDGQGILVGHQNTVRLLPLSQPRNGPRLYQHVSLAADGSVAAGTSTSISLAFNQHVEPTVRTVRVESGREISSFDSSGHARVNQPSAIAPDGQTIAVALMKRHNLHDITLWRTSDAVLTETLPHDCGFVTVINWDGSRKILIGNRDGVIRYWDLKNRTFSDLYELHHAEVSRILVSQSGEVCVSSDLDGKTIYWELDSGEVLHEFAAPGQSVGALAWDESSNRLAIGTSDGTVTMWNLADGSQIQKFPGHESPIAGLTLATDIDRLFVLATQGTVSVWDLTEGHLVAQFVQWTVYESDARAYLAFDTERRNLYINNDVQRAAPWQLADLGAVSTPWRAHYETTRVLPTHSREPAVEAGDAVIHRGALICAADIDESIEVLESYLGKLSDDDAAQADPEGVLLNDSLLTGACEVLGVDKFVKVSSIHGLTVDSPKALRDAMVRFREDWHGDTSLVLHAECDGNGVNYRHNVYVRPTELFNTEAAVPQPMALMLLRGIVAEATQTGEAVMQASLEWHPGVQLDNAPAAYRPILERIGFAIDDILMAVDGIPLISLDNFNRAFEDAIGGVEAGSRDEIRFDLKRGAYQRVDHTIRIE